jgi:uncharacterized protein YbbK (DUF523 family)
MESDHAGAPTRVRRGSLVFRRYRSCHRSPARIHGQAPRHKLHIIPNRLLKSHARTFIAAEHSSQIRCDLLSFARDALAHLNAIGCSVAVVQLGVKESPGCAGAR